MSLSSYSIQQFGGLNIASDPQEVGVTGALDIYNIDFDKQGRLRTRNGTANWSSADAASDYSSVFAINYGSRGLLSHRVAATTGTYADFVQFGTPTVQYTYFVNPGSAGTFERWDTTGGVATANTAATTQVQRWDGAAFNNPAGLVAIFPSLLSVQSPDNRLVAANFSANPSRVHFSNAGLAETFGANDFVELTPGDGEVIVGLESWREQLFAIKQTKFFVFTGNSISGTGTPIFNYRMVNTGIGGDYLYATCSAPDGIYFANRQGIWRTTGGPPERISAPLDPLFRQDPDLNTTVFGNIFATVRHMSYVDGKILIGIADDQSTVTVNVPPVPKYTLVYDIYAGAWSLWNVLANSYTGLVVRGPANPTLVYAAYGGLRIRNHTVGLTTDLGAAMAARYQSGFYELSPGNKATTRWTKVWGSGAPIFDVYTDHATSDLLTRGGTVTLGTSPAVSSTTHNKSYNGELFSHRLSSTSGAWSVNRIQHDIAETSKP